MEGHSAAKTHRHVKWKFILVIRARVILWVVLITNKSASCHFDSSFFEFVARFFRWTTCNGAMYCSPLDTVLSRERKFHVSVCLVFIRFAQLIGNPFIIRTIYYWSRFAFYSLAEISPFFCRISIIDLNHLFNQQNLKIPFIRGITCYVANAIIKKYILR